MSSNQTNNSFLKQGSILALTSIVVRLIGMIYRIPLTNIIGDEGNGIYSPAFELYSLLLILSSNAMPMAVSKMVSEKMAVKKYKESQRVFSVAYIFSMCTGGAAALILFFFADWIEKNLYTKYTGISIPLKILAPTIFVVAMMGVLRGFFEGNKTMIPTAFSQLVEQIVNAIVSVVAAFYFVNLHSASKNVSAWGAAGGTLGTCIGAVAGFIILILILLLFMPMYKRKISHDKRKNIMSKSDTVKLVFLTVTPIILSQTVYQISGTLDTIIFSKCMDLRGYTDFAVKTLQGIYSTKYRLLVNVPIAISTSIASSMIPSLVRAYIKNEKTTVKSCVNLAVKFNMIIAIPAAVGLSVLGEPIIRLLFRGSDYKIAGQMLLYGSICIIFYALSTVTSGILQGINKMTVPVFNAAISLVIHVVLVTVLLLFTPLGAFSLVIGNVTYPIVVCILNAFSVKKYLGISQELKTTFIIPFVVSIVMGIITFGLYFVLFKLTKILVVSVLVSIFIGITVYFVGVLRFKALSKAELYEFPFGRTIYAFAVKIRIM